MASVELIGVCKTYGDAADAAGNAVSAVRDVSLRVADGEMVALVGPSGCGKSTLLRLIAGLEEASAGRIVIDGADATAMPAQARGLSMVFQSYALYPHKTVAENMGFALQMAGERPAQVADKVARAAEILNLGDLMARKPSQLSGGQRQRVAIGRAIVRNPKVFLFDEPLSNLDAALRAQMRVEIARLRDRLNATMIYVTHDQVEAMTLADRIVALSAGAVEQIGAPLELYNNPINQFVAGFLGSPRMNILPCAAGEGGRPGRARLASGEWIRSARPLRAGAGAPAFAGIRSEHVILAGAQDESGDNTLRGESALVERLGADTFAHITLADGAALIARFAADVAVARGDALTLLLDAAHVHLFDADGAAITTMQEQEKSGG